MATNDSDTPGQPNLGAKPRHPGLANLKPIRKGEVRNPKGNNGSHWLSTFRAFFDEPDEAEPDKTKYRQTLLSLYAAIRGGDVNAIRIAVEQLAGKPKQRVEVTGQDGGPIESLAFTTAEKRAMLEALLAEPEDGKEHDGSGGPSEAPPVTE